ncbi:MAG: 3-hydroxyacyl-CoA dehydrogenase family protein [Thermodesulfobacteriota bacterium]
MNFKALTFPSVAVIGAGLMGHGIAQIFALSGRQVWLNDLDEQMLEQAVENVRSNLALFVENELISPEAVDPALAMIKTTTSLEKAAGGADYVVEAVSENLEIKQSIFKKMDAICPPETILSTNTSVISITEIASMADNRSRIIGTHFWNPPHLIPLVEVVPGDDTAPETVEQAYSLLVDVGKKPVRIKHDVPGFVGNRLQHALWREALSIVDQGIADAAEVDEVVKMGFGIRLPVLGPLENADLVGLELTHAVHDYLLKHLEDSSDPAPILKRKIDKGHLGFKSGSGLQNWTEQDIADTRSRLADHLIAWNKAQHGK